MRVNRNFIHFSIYDEMLLNFFPSFLWHFLILFLFSFHCFRMAMFSTNICVGKEIEAREKNETAATVNKCVNRINLHLLYFHYVQAQNARPIQATDDNFTVISIYRHTARRTSVSRLMTFWNMHIIEWVRLLSSVYWMFGIQPNWVSLIERKKKMKRERASEREKKVNKFRRVAWTVGSHLIEMQKYRQYVSHIQNCYAPFVSEFVDSTMWNKYNFLLFFFITSGCDRHRVQRYKFDYIRFRSFSLSLHFTVHSIHTIKHIASWHLWKWTHVFVVSV